MTANKRSNGQATGVMLAFLFIMSCFLGYQVGSDIANKENAAQAGPLD